MRGARFRLTLLLGALIALTPLGTDLYVPALPAIAQVLQASVAGAFAATVEALIWVRLAQGFGLSAGPVAARRRAPAMPR